MASELSGKLNNKRRQLRGLHVRHDGEQLIKGERATVFTGKVEETKQVRRQIANKNERRRMESINAGFQALRDLLPQRIDGERVSKAAILQQAVDHVMRLTKEHACLLLENDSLRRNLQDQSTLRQLLQDSMSSPTAPPPHSTLPSAGLGLGKRQKCDIESSCEDNMSLYSDDVNFEELYRHLADVKAQLEQERRLRLAAEEKLATSEHCSGTALPAHCSDSLLSPLPVMHFSEALGSPVRTHCSAGDRLLAPVTCHVGVEQQKLCSQQVRDLPVIQLRDRYSVHQAVAHDSIEQQRLTTIASVQPSTSPSVSVQVAERVAHRRTIDTSAAGSVGLDTIVAAIQYVEGRRLVTEEELAEESQSSAHMCEHNQSPSPPSPLCLVTSVKRDAAIHTAMYAGQFVALSEALLASRDNLSYNRTYPAPVSFRVDAICGM